jgi:hypothetical protein
LDPLKRIGSGGIDNDFKAIKSHPFFKKINWEKLNTAKPNSILIQNGIFPNSNHNSNLVSPLNLLCSNNNNFHRDYSIDKSKFNSVDEISPFKIKSLNTKYENNENVVFECTIIINKIIKHWSKKSLHGFIITQDYSDLEATEP